MTTIQNPSFENGTEGWLTEFNNGWSTGTYSGWHTDGSWCGYTTSSANRSNPGDYSFLTQKLDFTNWTAITFDINLPDNPAFELRVYVDDDLLYSHTCDGEVHLDCSAEAKYLGEHILRWGIYCISTETASIDTYLDNFRTEDIPTPPTITNVSWSPAGDFHKLPSGASLPGSTEDLYLIGTDPGAFADPGFSDGEALLRIGTDGAMFAVAEGDHFRFDDMEWWILNIICGPECSFITLADENAEAAREPKIGDEIQFSCNVDWHGEEPDEVRWYYAKTPNRCFDEGDVSWTPFANEQFPLHVFEEDDDTDIVFIKAWARNATGEIGELGDTCEPVFNLWVYHPSWWDSLLESIRSVDETIAKPILDLFAVEGLEGWTEPPFTCPICEQVFDGSDANMEYAEHLMSHIKAFEKGWFEQ